MKTYKKVDLYICPSRFLENKLISASDIYSEKTFAIHNFIEKKALPEKIDVIRKVFVGLNMNETETWDICLESEFDTLDDVKYYAAHPDQIAAAGILKDVKQDRACVDYEY